MSPMPRDAFGEKPALQTGTAGHQLPDSLETDVVVVGAGASGLAAANAAAAQGQRVVIVEARAEAGGTTAKSAGGFMVTNNAFHRAAGVHEDRDATLRLMASTSFPDRYDPEAERLGLGALDYALITTFYDRSEEVAVALADDGVLTFAPQLAISGDSRGFPSYFTHLDDETIYYGRTLTTRTPDGLEGYGRELVRQLLAGAERKGARLLTGQRVVEILTDGDEVCGVRVDSPSGTRTIHARVAVVFGSGGFAHNVELVERHLPPGVFGGCAVPQSQGDLISLTAGLDVDLAHLDCAWWGEVPVEVALENRETPVLLFYPFGDSMFYVNREGRRVVNEKKVYDQRGPVHFAVDADGGQPNRLLFMIYDQAVANEPTADYPARWPVPAAGQDAPHVIRGDTLEELEANIRARLSQHADRLDGFGLADDFGAGLRETVARFNRFADRGVDEDFHRGEQPIELDCAGPPRKGNHPNPVLFPLAATGPYYCIITGAGLLDTKGGPRITTDGQILRKDGNPVPRLYGAGNCIASPAAAAYWTGGTTIGLGMTYGYLAGQHAGRLSPREPVAEPAVAV
ncbi:MAG TPA: FAD-dependent oxidoreductase [Baekduia sp.]